jgi:hypothetical protein
MFLNASVLKNYKVNEPWIIKSPAKNLKTNLI